MELVNLTHNYLKLKKGYSLKGLKKLILLPDYSPAGGILPVGSVAVFNKKEHKITSDFLGPDIGCGMLLAKFSKPLKDIEYTNYKLVERLRSKTEMGSLGGGNHFIDMYESDEINELGLKKGDMVTLIHSGSRLEGQYIFLEGSEGWDYYEKYCEAVEFGKENRRYLLKKVEKSSENKLEIIFDRIHNTLEESGDNIIYRKGAIKLKPNEIGILSSCMGEDALIIKAKEKIKDLEYSICHGTGRKISRSDAKEIEFDSGKIRDKICIPSTICDRYFKTEAPHCYNTLEETLPPLKDYVEVIGKLKAKSYVC